MSFYCLSILGQKKKQEKKKGKLNIKSIQKLGNTWNKGKRKVEWKAETDLKKTVNTLFHFESDCWFIYKQNHDSPHISPKPAVSFLDLQKWVAASSFKVETVKPNQV